MPRPSNGTKTCPSCGNDYPVDQFYKDNSSYSGRKSRCSTCLSREAVRRTTQARGANLDDLRHPDTYPYLIVFRIQHETEWHFFKLQKATPQKIGEYVQDYATHYKMREFRVYMLVPMEES